MTLRIGAIAVTLDHDGYEGPVLLVVLPARRTNWVRRWPPLAATELRRWRITVRLSLICFEVPQPAGYTGA